MRCHSLRPGRAPIHFYVDRSDSLPVQHISAQLAFCFQLEKERKSAGAINKRAVMGNDNPG
jgi:hypothetical protein